MRALVKAISYRSLATVVTIISVWAITRSIRLMFALSVLDLLGKIVLYWLHELVWERAKKNGEFDWKKPTVQMLGRWQPWHAGHRALFERAIKKTGQVVIQIRDCNGWEDNPFDSKKVAQFIHADLDPQYKGMFIVQIVPNVVNITYGRGVGYKIEEELFDESITSISATEIRKAIKDKKQ